MTSTTRTTVLKTHLNVDEHAAFHRACAAANTTRAAKVREFCNDFARLNDRSRRRLKEGPSSSPGRALYFPGHRVSYGMVPHARYRL